MPSLRRTFCYAHVAVLLLFAGQCAWGQVTPPPIRFPSGGGSQATIPATNGPATTGGAPTFGPGPAGTFTPGAALNGTVTPTIPSTMGFDPYADPTLPAQPYYDPNATPFATNQQPLISQATFGQWPRFLQQLRFRQTWLARNGNKGVGWTSSELSGTFLIPLFFLPQNAPLLVTPGFALHFVDGPSSATGADLPPRLYDAYIDVGWTPQITYGLSADLGVRGGIYSDFSSIVADSFRIQGRGFGVWQTNDTHQWRAGIVYIDRVGIKLLPAGGLVWTPGGPNGNVRADILFPNPKFAFRLATFRTTDLWWYIAGEYGGGSWFVDRQAAAPERFDYNDIRLISGLEWTGHYGLKGFVEAGWVLQREIDYENNDIDTKLPQTLMVRGGLTY